MDRLDLFLVDRASESIPIADSLLNDALPAFFGFAGVVVGALLTPVMTRRMENHRDLEQARTAWTLLREDADSAARAVREREAEGEWPIGWNRDWSSVWRSSRGALARRVASKKRFRRLAEAFERMDELESAVNTRRENRSLSDKDRQFLASISEAIRRAQEALEGNLDDLEFSPSRDDPAMD
jgi:hypothetical protein